MAAVGTYNSIALTANTPMPLTLPGAGHYTLYFLNTAGGKLYISDKSNAGNNATSFMLPSGLYSPALPVSHNVWITSDTAGSVSICCVPAR